MMKSLVVIVILFASAVAAKLSLFNDPCRLTPYPYPLLGKTITAHTDKMCQKGWIYWNYPQGNLRVVFERENPSASFQVCLLNGGGSTYYDRAVDVTTGKELPVKNGDTHCVKSTNGGVTVEFQSDKLEYYMAVVSYELVDDTKL